MTALFPCLAMMLAGCSSGTAGSGATAGEQGASVIIIDKETSVGGNTILSGGAFNTADPEVQKLDTISESQKKERASYLDIDEADFGDFGPTLSVLKEQISESHNLRDFYIRTITVGGQKEELYNEVDLQSIGYAFRRASQLE